MEEAIVTKEITEAETAPESPIKDEPDAIVQKQLFATKEITEAETAPESPKKNLRLLWKKQL